MLDQKIIEWIEKEIEGTIRPDEKHKLHSYLKENPEASAYYKDQILMADLLDNVQEVEPPPNLRDRILDAVDMSRYAAKGKRMRFRSSSYGKMKLNPRLALAFGLGLIIGVLIPMFIKWGESQDYRLNRINFIGTVGVQGSGNFIELERTPIDEPGIEGYFSISQWEHMIACEIHLNSMEEVELLLRFSPPLVKFYGSKPHPETTSILENGNDYVKVQGVEEIRYLLFLQKKIETGTPIEITITQMGRELVNQSVLLESSH
jgi:hypothetical protein